MKVFISGTAGFIGFHVANLLLSEGIEVFGYDSMSSYYDRNLKEKRHNILKKFSNFFFIEKRLEDFDILNSAISDFKPNIIIHLAAQAGVRHSIDHPKSYIDSNIIGTFNILEIAKKNKPQHILLASTSSIYAANEKIPFTENDKADHQLSIYSSTKKACESIAHSYSHVWKIPITVFRFFTVYGPWGRPDMAIFKFVSSILDDKPIDIYNYGDMYRDFTYIDDLVKSIRLLIEVSPNQKSNPVDKNDSISPVAPFRIINIGNSKKVKLINLVEIIEKNLNKKALYNYLPLQIGDVKTTFADNSLLHKLIGYVPQTDIELGVKNFIDWYKNHYNLKEKV